ncbi:MAG: aldo/keto reductase [Rhizorhabdus sp.]
MRYRRLGKSGLKVSQLCLGCMSFGDPGKGWHSWVIGEGDARPIIRRAVEAGINFFDTSNNYSGGVSEEIIGRALKEYGRRDELVVATKAWGKWGEGPNQGGLGRKALLQAIDDSLRRLGTDYVDLYQIHRWDTGTPVEETLETLDGIVRAGKARYIGASSMFAWQFQKALALSERNGWARFVSMQNHLNLLYREEEREMLPLCRDAGVGVIPWSPLARGNLARAAGGETARSRTDEFGKGLYAGAANADRGVIAEVERVAAGRGVPMAQVALAWLLAKPEVAAPIVGITRLAQLEDALGGAAIELSPEEVSALEAPYVPHPVQGHH